MLIDGSPTNYNERSRQGNGDDHGVTACMSSPRKVIRKNYWMKEKK